jgi:hypothetical protein
MIKFLCVSCGERLSVPDQNAGRKGVCPTCRAVNRIPLKGFPETQPNTPTVARSADKPFATPADSLQAKSPESHRSAEARRYAEHLGNKPIIEVHRPEPGSQPFQNSASIFNSPGHLSREAAEFAEPSEMVQIDVRRRLPRKVKLTLLILAALAIVAALYLALYTALNAFIKASS